VSLSVAVIAPVYNEAQFLPYSIMAAHPYVTEFVYAVAPKSDDGTIEILRHIAKNYGNVRILLQHKYDFDPMDTKAYNEAFNDCIEQTRCDVVWFLHPDMILTKWNALQAGPMAWTTNITSYAGDMNTVITKGRCKQWKNIHAKTMGLMYSGGYGSANEDFYHREITGTSLKHYGSEFSKYPFEVGNSGIEVNHYCELKPYRRRLEKMKLCLKTQFPDAHPLRLEEMAVNHPRVTLEQSCNEFGAFEFTETNDPIPEVFEKYRAEFEPFTKELITNGIHG
jgi:glycosyltransferase involved in cell wall biosynthesis